MKTVLGDVKFGKIGVWSGARVLQAIGSDFPYRTAAEPSEGVEAIFGEEARIHVNRENSLRILPQLRAA